jgi:hypothetical protein
MVDNKEIGKFKLEAEKDIALAPQRGLIQHTY